MKSYGILLIIIMAAIFSCKTSNNTASASAGSKNDIAATSNDTVRIANDTLEYEIIIIDPGFNTWLASRAQPRGYYSQSHLEVKNKMWITEWNIRAQQPQRYGDLYQMQVDYQPGIDYGYEVNYLLYNYLVYFQLTNNQRLGGLVPQF